MKRSVNLLLLAAGAAAALAVATTGEAPAQTGGVLVVGDSLEVGTGPYLRRELGRTPLTIDARKSRPSAVGLGILSKELRPSHRVVVFDLGVNDGPSQTAALARTLEAVRKVVGDRCLIVATLSRPPLNGVRIDGMNRVIADFVAKTPRGQLVDWHDATAGNPGVLAGDGVHATPAGYATRARLLAGAIGSCLDPGTPADDTGLPRPRDKTPAPPPPEGRHPPREPAWLTLLRRLPYRALFTIAQGGMDREDEATREMIRAVSPQPPEPTLGAPPGGSSKGGSRRRAPAGGR